MHRFCGVIAQSGAAMMRCRLAKGRVMKVMRRTVAPQFQRRATLRHDVSVRGAIIVKLSLAMQTLGCLIVDLSLGGAKVKLDENYALPPKVLLFEAHRENVYECSVRWQDTQAVGLSFLDQFTISARRALLVEVSQGLVASMREQGDEN
jgi:c-di-GMP-binding flagellar brake protein YcgR